ncbi:SET domain-containing protein-lysine N-methyltransferase [Luteolibacter yonseiensis]|uniref:SET domain-containing protein-lysine N-methyltransferase n=1 Tax=Luteolibacter yonseiensis TaxID=1144680 RepID=A0A934R7W9_9BACT|nr:SET domain-containing protein-lysine N-methyltransferase [Luteolibacter yonseiensis]MBK1817937.1 SET domain-containing protein-lysine N-methyltransferase [Luteolibacter yonseiensis]
MAAKKTGKNSVAEQNTLHRKLLELWKRGQSEHCEVRGSEIHGRGVYATTFIPKETKIIEYVGELIDKTTSEKRGISQQEKSVTTGDAAVYIFTLSKNYDIDGNVPWNTARLINHSCAPNCEAWIEGRKIFIHALRDIDAGEELTFDYGFDVECYEDHPCRCGKDGCVGYIVSRSQWKDLAKKLEAKALAG